MNRREIARDPRWYYHCLGYLPQHFEFYDHLDLRRGLLYLANLKGLSGGIARDRVNEVLGLVGLAGLGRRRFADLSVGLKQRVGLAQALLNDPDVLLLDEPTSAQDPAERQHLQFLLSELGRERIILYSTHLPEEITGATTLTFIREGRVIFYGTPGDFWCLEEGATATEAYLKLARKKQSKK